MQETKSPDTPESWNAASEGYAEKVAPILMDSFMAEFVDRLDPQSDHKALEIAAGSGAMTQVLAPRVHSLLATDFAPEMIEVLRARMAAAGHKNLSFDVMDGQALSLEDQSFNRVASSFAVMLFPDRSKGFSEIHRVLRPGGRAVVSGWAGPDKFEGFELFLASVKLAYPDMPPPTSPPPVFRLADPVAFKAEMESAGFKEVEVDFVSRDMTIDSFQTIWELFTSGAPPVQMLLNRLGPEANERVHAGLAKVVEQRFGSGPITLTNVATLGTGVVE